MKHVIAASILAIGIVVAANAQNGSLCPSGDVQHWDKIIFEITKDRNRPSVIPESYLKARLDIRVLADPGTLLNTQTEASNAVATRFGLLESQLDKLVIRVLDVKYEVIACLQGPRGQRGLQGLRSTRRQSSLRGSADKVQEHT